MGSEMCIRDRGNALCPPEISSEDLESPDHSPPYIRASPPRDADDDDDGEAATPNSFDLEDDVLSSSGSELDEGDGSSGSEFLSPPDSDVEDDDIFRYSSPEAENDLEPSDTFSELRDNSYDIQQESTPEAPTTDNGDDEAIGLTPTARAASQEPGSPRQSQAEISHAPVVVVEDEEETSIDPEAASAQFISRPSSRALSTVLTQLVSSSSRRALRGVSSRQVPPPSLTPSNSAESWSWRSCDDEAQDVAQAALVPPPTPRRSYAIPAGPSRAEDEELPDAQNQSRDETGPPASDPAEDAEIGLPPGGPPYSSQDLKRERNALFTKRFGIPPPPSTPPHPGSHVGHVRENAFVFTSEHVRSFAARFHHNSPTSMWQRENEVLTVRNHRRTGSLLRREVLPENVREPKTLQGSKKWFATNTVEDGKKMVEQAKRDLEQMQSLKENYHNLDMMHADTVPAWRRSKAGTTDVDPRPSPKLRLKIPDESSEQSFEKLSEKLSEKSSEKSSETIHTPPATDTGLSKGLINVQVLDWRLDSDCRTISYLVTFKEMATGSDSGSSYTQRSGPVVSAHMRNGTEWYTCIQTRSNGYKFSTDSFYWPPFAKHRYEALHKFDSPYDGKRHNPYMENMLGRAFLKEKVWYSIAIGSQIGGDTSSDSESERATAPRPTSEKVDKGKSKMRPSYPSYSDDVPESTIRQWGATASPITDAIAAETLGTRWDAAMKRFEDKYQAEKKWEAESERVQRMTKGWFR